MAEHNPLKPGYILPKRDDLPTPAWGKPYVGAMVYFKSQMGGETGNGRPYAPAFITWVHEGGRVNLFVLRDIENMVPFPSVQHESEPAARNWYWPPRE